MTDDTWSLTKQPKPHHERMLVASDYCEEQGHPYVAAVLRGDAVPCSIRPVIEDRPWILGWRAWIDAVRELRASGWPHVAAVLDLRIRRAQTAQARRVWEARLRRVSAG